MSRSEQPKLIFLVILIFFLGMPGVSLANIEFRSSLASLQSVESSIALFEETRFLFSSDEKPFSYHFSGHTVRTRDGEEAPASQAALDQAYLTFRSTRLSTDFSLGRLHVDEGLTRKLIEGVHTRTRSGKRTGFAFFTGRTVHAEATDLAGGRIWYSFDNRTTAGISYGVESDGLETIREEAAIDLRLHASSRIFLSGRSLADLRTGGWAEHSYSARVGPFRKAMLLFNASLVDYRDAGDPVQLPSFGAGIQYPLSRRLVLEFDARRTEDPFAGETLSEGILLRYSPRRTLNAGLSLRQSRGGQSDILTASAHAAGKMGKLESSVTVQQVTGGNDFLGGEKNALSAGIRLAREISPAYRLIADLQGSRDSVSRPDLAGFVKLEYRFRS